MRQIPRWLGRCHARSTRLFYFSCLVREKKKRKRSKNEKKKRKKKKREKRKKIEKGSARRRQGTNPKSHG
ncbi:unnamed protein product [Diplocarpon coronariae]